MTKIVTVQMFVVTPTLSAVMSKSAIMSTTKSCPSSRPHKQRK